jgi:hypothetical protein
MEQRIIKKARPGTILVAPYDTSMSVRAGLDCTQVEGPIFVVGIEQADADQLRYDADATGTEILYRSANQIFDAGYWAPILDSGCFNGIG